MPAPGRCLPARHGHDSWPYLGRVADNSTARPGVKGTFRSVSRTRTTGRSGGAVPARAGKPRRPRGFSRKPLTGGPPRSTIVRAEGRPPAPGAARRGRTPSARGSWCRVRPEAARSTQGFRSTESSMLTCKRLLQVAYALGLLGAVAYAQSGRQFRTFQPLGLPAIRQITPVNPGNPLAPAQAFPTTQIF